MLRSIYCSCLLVFLFPLLTSKVAHSATAESARKAALGQAQTEMQLMDLATPEELQAQWGLTPGMNSEMVRESDELSYRTSYDVEIEVSIATQTLTITYPGGEYSTLISSARHGYHTATGCFTHPHLELMHYSKKYKNSPMPHSMFFYGGYAIHGTEEEKELGRPASHGCVRVSRADAEYLYGIVENFGAANTRICIH
jgi:lipoprotein-anchoring transpeptidase ErfK/SrfK